jgi:hypothetical protein
MTYSVLGIDANQVKEIDPRTGCPVPAILDNKCITIILPDERVPFSDSKLSKFRSNKCLTIPLNE